MSATFAFRPEPGIDGGRTPVRLPEAPILAVGLRFAVWLMPDGEVRRVGLPEGRSLAHTRAPILCHATATARRLGCGRFPALDLLELFAFTHPARFCIPTARGLAGALGLSAPPDLEGEAIVLRDAMVRLAMELAGGAHDADVLSIARAMSKAGWVWGPTVLSALGEGEEDASGTARGGLRVWERLTTWSDQAPAAAPRHSSVDGADARLRLSELLGSGAEPRPQQADFTYAVTQAFAPRARKGEPHVVLAEAGTGIGKTLGYIAPASLWTEKNRGPVWISTYTRNLQHQIDGELDRLFPDLRAKARKVVIRKGRENYLCLLNYEDAVNALPYRPRDTLAIGLMARWAAQTRDGDMVGGDFPGWLPDLVGRSPTIGLSDHRGECIYSACPHYSKCYIERSIRQARRADFVVTNHALSMIQAALGEGDDGYLPTHVVFDEGHHLFDAADGVFAAHLSAKETAELRRWLLGADERSRSAGRVRGLKRRMADLVSADPESMSVLDKLLRVSRILPGERWRQRLANGEWRGPVERFLLLIRRQVFARAANTEGPYGLETETRPIAPELEEAAAELDAALLRLLRPLLELERRLAERLEAEADRLDSETRWRIEVTCRGLSRRAILRIGAWREMLATLGQEPSPDFVDWFTVERIDGRELDVGMYRHWIDPTIPFAEAIARPVHGLVITSATLTDGTGDPEVDWAAAEVRTGATHLPRRPLRAQVASPFDYAAQTRVLIVNDVRKEVTERVAAAYRELFLTAGGGALGLFTAISRLRHVYERIAGPLEAAGVPLFAQHVDALDTSTLVEIFRAEENACLLGTDAVRDGVDVPGRSLRLIVFDRVPWPRPDIRHRARRERFGGRAYDDMLTRLRLKQAYGRLIRRGSDRGVFVLLDPMMPSRLHGAFPAEVTIQKVGLAEAVAETGTFLAPL